MGRLLFYDDTEVEISNISSTSDNLKIEIDSSDVNNIIEKFKDNPTATYIMRYYEGIDLLRGYAGYMKLENVQYIPDVTVSINYETTDSNTESGFKETKIDRVIVTMKKGATQTTSGTEDVFAIATDVKEIKEDIQKINNTLEGIL